jgi:outer membrane protein assembly factor BamB
MSVFQLLRLCLPLLGLALWPAPEGFARETSRGEPTRREVTADEVRQGFVEGRVLAQPRTAWADRENELAAEENALGVVATRVFRHAGHIRVLEFERAESVAAALSRLRASGLYEYVEADRVVHEQVLSPNDPRYANGNQWSLNNTGQNSGVPDADIDAPEGWAIRTDASGIIVAVIDSGARLTHEDLAANLWRNPSPGTSGYNNDLHGIDAIVPRSSPNSGNPVDGSGHGSHVAGIIGAVGNNGRGIAGVAWRTQLMILRFLPNSGSGSTADAIECIDYAIARGARVINASYGSDTFSQAEFNAIRRARDAGIIFVAAAGNDGRNLDVGRAYPTSYLLDNIVSVASSTRLEDLSPFSNFGSGAVDLAAPGSEILSLGHTADDSYVTRSGTSMAAPHVTGVVALLLAHFPGETYRQTINRLLQGVSPRLGYEGRVHTGGRLNLARALSTTHARPFHDDFDRAARLEGGGIQARTANQHGTREPGEPLHAGQPGGASLWWTWTAPSTGATTIDTAGSAIDTVLAVYTGNSLGSLTLVAANDDIPGGTTSRVSFTAQADTTYRIAVDGKHGATGLIVLNLGTVPANDNFASPAPLEGASPSLRAANSSATKEAGEPNHAGQPGGRSLWYRWTAPTSRSYTVSVFSNDFNPVVAVYTGTTLGNLTVVAANDDIAPGINTATATFQAQAGTPYRIAVDSVGSVAGEFTLTIVDSDWQVSTAEVVTSSPAQAPDGTLYVGSFDGRLYAFNPDGSQRWQFSTGAGIDMSSPAIGPDGAIYIGSNDRSLRAINPGGSLRWTFTTGAGISASAAIAPDGTIYVRSDDTNLYALHANGSERWRVGLGGVSFSSPSIGPDGTVYVGSDNNRLYAISPEGAIRWTFTADGGIYTSPAIGADGTIYFGTIAGRFYAVAPSGQERWSQEIGGGISSSPAIGPDGTLYFGAYTRRIYALDPATGDQRWSYLTGDEIRASGPAVGADGAIYAGSYDGYLYVLNPDGTLRRRFATGARIRSSPLVTADRVYVGSNDFKLYALPIAGGPASSAWPMFRRDAARSGRFVAPPNAAPQVVSQPQSQVLPDGGPVLFSVQATGEGPFTYQWFKDGVPISGATADSFLIAAATTSDSGSYTVAISNTQGTTLSTQAMLVVTSTGDGTGRLLNLATRGFVGTGDSVLIAGFFVAGEAPKMFLVRGVGPRLADFGLGSAALADPVLRLRTAGVAPALIATNDAWSASPDANGIAAAAAAVGAFELFPGSRDAALIVQLPPGGYTAELAGINGSTGIGLVEVYEVDRGSPERLRNLSTRGFVGNDQSILIPGLVVGGTSPRTFVIRAVGETLGQPPFNVAGVLADPLLRLTTRTGVPIAENDDWGQAPNVAALQAAFDAVGAFALTSGSRDAALLVTLDAGEYTVQVSGKSGATGVVLVEVYELP